MDDDIIPPFLPHATGTCERFYAGAVGDGQKVLLLVVGAAVDDGAEGGVFGLQGGVGGLEGFERFGDGGADGLLQGVGIGTGADGGDGVFCGFHLFFQGGFGCGKILEIDDAVEVGVLEADFLLAEIAEGGLLLGKLLGAGGSGEGNLIG